jgi:hypothetical protein
MKYLASTFFMLNYTIVLYFTQLKENTTKGTKYH